MAFSENVDPYLNRTPGLKNTKQALFRGETNAPSNNQ